MATLGAQIVACYRFPAGVAYARSVGEADEDLGRLEAFTYLTVPERAAYLAIMRLFTTSLMTDLSAQQVVEELPAADHEFTLDTR